MKAVKEKNLIYQTEIEYCGKKYNYVARLSKSLEYCPDQPFLNRFKTDQVTITPLVPKDGVPTHFQFYYDLLNGRMLSFQMKMEDSNFYRTMRTDWFDSFDGNIYYSVVEKKLGEDLNFPIFKNRSEQAGRKLNAYEKYEWREIHHLPPVSKEVENSSLYIQTKKAWENHQFVLTETDHKNEKESSLLLFLPVFDEYFIQMILTLVKQQNHEEIDWNVEKTKTLLLNIL